MMSEVDTAARKPVPPPGHHPTALALRKIGYGYWKPGFAHTPPANCPAQVGQSRQLHQPAQNIGYVRIFTNEKDPAAARKAPRTGLGAPRT